MKIFFKKMSQQNIVILNDFKTNVIITLGGVTVRNKIILTSKIVSLNICNIYYVIALILLI